MNLSHDAMLVSLRISNWSGRMYDREASEEVAAQHQADPTAGRYNKRILPKAALAKLTAATSRGRTLHYLNTLPWDDSGSRLLTVANYDRYTEIIDELADKLIAHRSEFIADYPAYIDQARIDLGGLFRIADYPSTESLRDKFAVRYRITPVPDADHFMARLASDDTDRVKRDIEAQVQERLQDAVTDLYRRLGEAVQHVSDRLRDGDNGKALIFRDTMIQNVRDLVDIVPRLNIFGDDRLAQLCQHVKDRIASVDPDTLRPSRQFDPAIRARVTRDATDLAARFAGYIGTPEPTLQEAA